MTRGSSPPYEQWDERNEPVDAFCKRMDLSKQSLYAVLRRNDVVPKTRRISAESTQGMLTKVLADLDQIKAALNIGERPVNGDRYNAGPGTDNRPVSAVRLRRRRRAPVSATPPIGDHAIGRRSSL